ncbi:hypothetical protein [uncultured Sneathia sp.]|uniref:hypothetical protein n=1 Tax=uncultured Sneathia sp. TaxID=278067 RepID=UPI00259360C8|nr:hypothetical protein [uncultured Sneathia sp.]
MLSTRKEIKYKVVDGKKYLEDEFININFIMEDLNCSMGTAYQIIRKANELFLKENKIEFIMRGRTTLRYYYKLNGLSGEFI